MITDSPARPLKLKQWKPSTQYRVLVFIPNPSSRPFHRSRELRRLRKYIRARISDDSALHYCVYGYPFGVVPLELDEIFPLSQYEASNSTTSETVDYVLQHIMKYILNGKHGCSHVVIHVPSLYVNHLNQCLKDIFNDKINVYLNPADEKIWSRVALERLVTKILSVLANINISG
jgi:predicted RNA-binding protein